MAAVKSSKPKRSKAEIEQEFSLLVEDDAREKNITSSKSEMAAQIQEMEI